MNIAIIGSGISGLTCAHLLSQKHNITLFEQNHYIGGHTNTVTVNQQGNPYRVDTGFIVCNDKTYPNFNKLMSKLGVGMQKSEMSFSCHNEKTGLEYNGNNLNTLFSQRKNLFSPKFYYLISQIIKFNKAAKGFHSSKQTDKQSLTLGYLIDELGFSNYFADHYILPMVAAIWSCSMQEARGFPLDFFLNFFEHHGLLNINDRPQWYVVEGGSSSYIDPITQPFSNSIELNSQVSALRQTNGKWWVTVNGDERQFDEVILACHSDQARRLLAGTDRADAQQLLSAMQYQSNSVLLHTDASIMPKHKRSWASWNFLLEDNPDAANNPALVSYYMNRLQGFDEQTPDFFVSLNAAHRIDEQKILRRFSYDHPIMDSNMINAQQQREQVCGHEGLHFCGAYWYNGFHEDGVKSALDVCRRFGVEL